MIIVVKAKLAPDDPLMLAAERMEPKIRDAFLAAVEAVKDQTDLDALEAAVASGDVNRVMNTLDLNAKLSSALGGAGLPSAVGSVKQAVQAAFAAGAEAAVENLPSTMQASIAFDLFNPKTVEFLSNYTFDMIRGITQQTADSIQQTLINAFQTGGHPRETAREIVQVIGLTPNQQAAVDSYRAALESGSTVDLRNALGRALRDGRYDRSLLNALSNSTSLTQDKIDAMVERYEARFLKYRATNIARTESLRAANRGQSALWSQAVEQGLLNADALREWVVSGDERTCEVCLDLDGETAGLEEEFAPGIMHPPDPHPSCRCTVKLVASGFKKRFYLVA